MRALRLRARRPPLAVLLAAVLPWLLRGSLRFRLRYSSYRGLRFRFTGTLPHAYYVFLLGWIGSVASFGLLAPFFHQRLKQYQHGNAAFGQAPFSFNAPVPPFYRVYLTGAALLIFVPVAVTLIWVAFTTFIGDADPELSSLKAPVAAYLVLAVYGSLVLLLAPYFNAHLQNLIWNHTRLGPHGFLNRLSARRLAWIYFSNLLALILTLGLFMPWAAVRLARYKAESLSLVAAGDIGEMLAGTAESFGAAGQETAEFFDIDIAL